MKIKTDTIVRTALLVVALINQGLTMMGMSLLPITDEQLTDIITLLITVGASLWAWWRNNSFTKHAVRADKMLEEWKKCE